MKKRTRSILEELNSLGSQRHTDLQIESTASNIIESATNLLERIEQNYDAETAGELQRRFINSIKAGDSKKFTRGIEKIKENRER